MDKIPISRIEPQFHCRPANGLATLNYVLYVSFVVHTGSDNNECLLGYDAGSLVHTDVSEEISVAEKKMM